MLSSLPQTATDNLSLPEETRIYNSKARPIFLMIVLLLWLAGGIALVYFTLYLIGVILIVLVLAGMFVTYKVLSDNAAQLVISIAGITTINDGFHRWEQISNEDIVKYGHGRQRSYYLIYQHPAGMVKMDIGWLKIKRDELQRLLVGYRGRFAAANNI